MRRIGLALLSAAAFSAADAPARAADLLPHPVSPVPVTEDYRWFVHVGPTGLFLNEGAKIKAFGTRLQGANISVEPQATLGVAVGYFVLPNVAIAFSGGLPPLAKIDGAGTLSGLGKLGSTIYGPMALTVQYHFNDLGFIKPYIGVGPMAMLVFSTKDAALSNIKLDNAAGAVVQIGVDVMLSQQWGLFVDAKKAYLRTDATGVLGPAPITARVRLDPLVVSTGITYKF